MRITYERVAGIDVHKKTVVVTRLRVTEEQQVEWETHTFGTTTPELLQAYDWLQEWECRQVALESTGDYWKPVYNLLEEDFEVWVVNAQHVKRVPGRKTDASDAEWLAELLAYGLLQPSFIPPKPQRALRELTRYRTRLIQERSRLVNRVQKLLEGANIKLASVATDLQGVSARAILAELAAGNTDAEALAELARGRLRNKIPELERALTGKVEPHHRFLLSQQLEHIDFLDEQVAEIEAEIERQLKAMSPLPEASETAEEATATPPTPAGSPISWSTAVSLLDTIPGINREAAQIILAEIGVDMSVFPTAGHLCRWAGVAPGNNESGGKHYSGRTTKGNRVLKSTLVECAQAAIRTKDSFFKARYQRLVARRGKQRAIMAIAHSILKAIWQMLRSGEVYHDLGAEYYNQRDKDAKVAYYTRQLEKLTGAKVQIALGEAMA